MEIAKVAELEVAVEIAKVEVAVEIMEVAVEIAEVAVEVAKVEVAAVVAMAEDKEEKEEETFIPKLMCTIVITIIIKLWCFC